ncbi:MULTISPECIES: site-specific integrase [Bacillus]|uniref:site-specific integrase n=1 Tax=Bacillus TaxID=1386 RepID=UPI001928DFC4|nr:MULTISPECIES: site-specific integrase [Bacillus]MBL3628506.1 site-specific integrase [Bacillus sp. RHF6]MED0781542.1 site-specific integrase [Bacillus siamensis]MED0836395.1 site-specific integrase [Bacillus siamensis]MED4526480.1 site-specific integrase [Bacillus velezensis]
MKMYKADKDDDLYYYFNAKKEKRWLYRYRYYDAFGKRREKSKQGFKKENEAYRALLEVKTSILNGDIKEVENENLTISEWLDIWYETNKNQWEISTCENRKLIIETIIKPLLGKIKLTKLDKVTYKRLFINELLKEYSPGSVAQYHATFKISINAAVDSEILRRNRFNKIIIPQPKKESENFYTASELREFLEAFKRYENITNYTMVELLAFTGMRRGEAMGLKWSDVDFEGLTISINRTRDANGIRSPKTKNSYRTIKVIGELITQLKVYRKWCKELMISFGKHLSEDDFIFINKSTTKPISHTVIRYAIDRVTKKENLKRITVHGLRHTHATILISKRIPVKVISDRLGNTPEMVLNTYGHSFKELEEESVEAFADALAL